ncbi:YybH family protein [Maribacter aurantiacus]|uniref:DUF4440 domain-containing protein n=1 Tax=Maribacter aurantiacus TaxID=1882343 RepID=A0A5R8LYT2_9FLAO|nr:DUF4440 domain-containing protein [Maribacter aurantiacus]TLF42571.1 DUF4440 domain-containing protein [Maribacter aurantiacus]
MKKQFVHAIVVLCAISQCWSCKESQEMEMQSGKEYSEEIKEIIMAKNAEIEKLYAEGMIDSAATHFAEDCIQLPPNQPAIIGNENYKAAWKQNMQFGTWEFDLNTEKVKASGDLATEYGSYSLTFSPNENSPIPAMEDMGNYVVLWEKIDDDWKVLWDAPVSSVPMLMQATDSIPSQ